MMRPSGMPRVSWAMTRSVKPWRREAATSSVRRWLPRFMLEEDQEGEQGSERRVPSNQESEKEKGVPLSTREEELHFLDELDELGGRAAAARDHDLGLDEFTANGRVLVVDEARRANGGIVPLASGLEGVGKLGELSGNRLALKEGLGRALEGRALEGRWGERSVEGEGSRGGGKEEGA